MTDNQFFLIVTPDCKRCGPYKEKLESWGVKFGVVDGSTYEGKLFCDAKEIQGAPNLVIMEGGRYVDYIPGAIFDREQFYSELRKKGVRV